MKVVYCRSEPVPSVHVPRPVRRGVPEGPVHPWVRADADAAAGRAAGGDGAARPAGRARPQGEYLQAWIGPELWVYQRKKVNLLFSLDACERNGAGDGKPLDAGGVKIGKPHERTRWIVERVQN